MNKWKVMITGGAGYVGSALAPKLLDDGRDLRDAFAAGKIPDPMNNPIYYNIKLMKQVDLH